jgi:hypothetical protein
MPNWCSNYLAIDGPAEDLVRFVNEAKHKTRDEDLISFNNHVPVWDGEKIIKDRDPSNDWGTKWEPSDIYVCSGGKRGGLEDAEKGSIAYSFQSAWAPPCEWMKVVTKLFPTLNFRMEYEEGGCDVYGYSTGEKGEFVDHFMSLAEFLEEFNDEYQNCQEEIKKMSQKDLIKYFSRIKNFTEWCNEEEEMDEECPMYVTYDFWPLAGTIIEALEVTSLPFFINVDWDDGEYNEKFKTRMREGK